MSSGVGTRFLQSKTDSTIVADGCGSTGTAVQKYQGRQRSRAEKAGPSSSRERTSPALWQGWSSLSSQGEPGNENYHKEATLCQNVSSPILARRTLLCVFGGQYYLEMKKLKYISLYRRQDLLLQMSNPLRRKQRPFQQLSYCCTSALTASTPAGQSFLVCCIIYLLTLTPNESFSATANTYVS